MKGMNKKSKDVVCCIQKQWGCFDMMGIQSMQKIHIVKNIKAAVEQEIIWFAKHMYIV